jgi:hypothetical protein
MSPWALDERLALQVLRSVPGFARLTEVMLRDCGDDAALRSLTLEPGSVVAEEGKPADAILIVKRGGLVVSSRKNSIGGFTEPRLLREREAGLSPPPLFDLSCSTSLKH